MITGKNEDGAHPTYPRLDVTVLAIVIVRGSSLTESIVDAVSSGVVGRVTGAVASGLAARRPRSQRL